MAKRGKSVRDEPGKWEFGGGQLEFGETPEEGALREVSEEYGVEGAITEALPTLTLLRENNAVKTHWVMHPFIVKVDGTAAKNNEPQSIDEIGWFDLDRPPQPLHTGAAAFLKKYKVYFDNYRKI
jgi:8-oxo-dGTP diphosphatase